jgi:hypothetical protein
VVPAKKKSTRKGQNHPENPALERIYEARRLNLSRIIREQFDNNRRELGRAAQVNPNHISLCLTDNELHRRNIGEDVARKLEVVLNLPEYAMDKPLTDSDNEAYLLQALRIPQVVQRALHECENLASVRITPRLASRLDGKISGLGNLFLASPATNEMEPELMAGDKLIIDQGVKEYQGDGYYVLCKGGSSFLRKVTKSLSGGYKLIAANSSHESLTVDKLKPTYTVWGRVVTMARLHMLV